MESFRGNASGMQVGLATNGQAGNTKGSDKVDVVSNPLRFTADDKNAVLLEMLLNAWKALYPARNTEVLSVHDDSAFSFLINGKSALALTGREISPVETVPYKKQRATTPFAIRIAVDGVQAMPLRSLSGGVYVNRANPLNELSVVDLRRIFTRGNPEGDCSDWGQLINQAEMFTGQIHAYLSPLTEPLGVYLNQHHFSGREKSQYCHLVSDTDEVLSRIANDPYGIGIAELGRETSDLRVLPITWNDLNPASCGSNDDLRRQLYPLARYLYLYAPVDSSNLIGSPAAEFLTFLLSGTGQDIIDHHSRYTSLGQAEREKQLQRLYAHL